MIYVDRAQQIRLLAVLGKVADPEWASGLGPVVNGTASILRPCVEERPNSGNRVASIATPRRPIRRPAGSMSESMTNGG